MKDFIKWLGVNEKVAKVVVWMFIIMVMLITINTALDSIGFPHYQITYENLKQINTSLLINTILSCLACIANFYCIVLLVFRVKETKKIFKYAILYMVLNWIITSLFGNGILQIYIFLFIILFCYLYSKKNWKYILYGILALFINTIAQGIIYLFKISNINYFKTNELTRIILFIDYLIIMTIIILVKEIFIKKRGEKICGADQEVGYGLENLKKKIKSQKNLQKKSQAQSNNKKKKKK